MRWTATFPRPSDDRGIGRRRWEWLFGAAAFDRRELSRRERHCLVELGADLLRRRDYRDDQGIWQPVDRLLRPVEAARAALRWHPADTRHHRRFAIDAIGLVLLRSGQLGTAPRPSPSSLSRKPTRPPDRRAGPNHVIA